VIDHLELTVSDLDRSTRFYAGALAPLGYARHAPLGFGADATRLDFWLRAGDVVTRPHFAFACASRAEVEAAHRAALEAGGVDAGAPRLLAHIAPDYYAGFVHDPDGHKVEFVARG
jgi:catechol 2,3-dioxygenase-like lactoylglutathione lyase family enzyme